MHGTVDVRKMYLAPNQSGIRLRYERDGHVAEIFGPGYSQKISPQRSQLSAIRLAGNAAKGIRDHFDDLHGAGVLTDADIDALVDRMTGNRIYEAYFC